MRISMSNFLPLRAFASSREILFSRAGPALTCGEPACGELACGELACGELAEPPKGHGVVLFTPVHRLTAAATCASSYQR